MKRSSIFLIIASILPGILLFISISHSETEKRRRAYRFTFSELKPFIELKIPPKYKPVWDDVIQAKRHGRKADEIVKLLKTPLEAITDKTITDPEVFKRELASIRDCGYAVDNEEITRGIMCVASPVFGFNGEVVCAISVTFPAYIMDDRGIELEIKAIKKYAALIHGSMGHR